MLSKFFALTDYEDYFANLVISSARDKKQIEEIVRSFHQVPFGDIEALESLAKYPTLPFDIKNPPLARINNHIYRSAGLLSTSNSEETKRIILRLWEEVDINDMELIAVRRVLKLMPSGLGVGDKFVIGRIVREGVRESIEVALQDLSRINNQHLLDNPYLAYGDILMQEKNEATRRRLAEFEYKFEKGKTNMVDLDAR